ncbi:MAG: Mur ligase family protein [Chloroflexi bacterium]|nr:Mur ligase family protein [Chloroflexota bacterium]
MRLNSLAALWLGKLSGAASRSLRRGGGTALPGVVARAIDPGLARCLAAQISGGSVLVTGTNGKTTTSRMIATILRQMGVAPLCNPSGSNLMRGVTAALVEEADFLGRLRRHVEMTGVFEVDEAVLPYAIEEVRPRVVVITNLFRDQLDRYGEVDSVAAIWREALTRLPLGASVVLNSDDPIVADVGRALENRLVYFGVEDKQLGRDWLEHAADSRWCPRCGLEYQYDLSYYGHIGHYYCPRCHLRRPDPQVKAERLQVRGFEGTLTRISTPDGEMDLEVRLPGIYNVYNALAACAVGHALGAPLEAVKRGLELFTAAFGRVERLEIEGRVVYLVLAKNPVGFNQVLSALLSDGTQKNLLLALNDGIADGQDVSWIWDVDFETLTGRVKLAVVSGLRAEDLALRLQYAGVSGGEGRFILEKDLAKAIRAAVRETPVGETLYLVPTYTAMLEARHVLVKQGYLQDYWETE